MFCPSCGKQIQENNSFCTNCGKPLTFNNSFQTQPTVPTPQPQQSTQNYAPKPVHTSHAGRNIAIGLFALVIISLIIAFGASSYLASLNSSGGGNGIFQTTHTTNIVNGLITVNANTYETYTFTIPSGASNIQVSGSFTASGGSGNDVKVDISSPIRLHKLGKWTQHPMLLSKRTNNHRNNKRNTSNKRNIRSRIRQHIFNLLTKKR